MPFLQDGKVTFVLSSAVLLITTSSFLAFSISLHSAYLWLAVVFVTLIFLATFTCTYSLPGYIVPNTSTDALPPSSTEGQTNFAVEMETGVPYWITVDLPPAYDMVAGILPPSYSKATGLALTNNPDEPDQALPEDRSTLRNTEVTLSIDKCT